MWLRPVDNRLDTMPALGTLPPREALQRNFSKLKLQATAKVKMKQVLRETGLRVKAPRKQKDAEKPQDVKVYVPQRNRQFSGFIRSPGDVPYLEVSASCACPRGSAGV